MEHHWYYEPKYDPDRGVDGDDYYGSDDPLREDDDEVFDSDDDWGDVEDGDDRDHEGGFARRVP